MSIILFLLSLTIIKAAECPNNEVTKEECASPCIWTKTKESNCVNNDGGLGCDINENIYE